MWDYAGGGGTLNDGLYGFNINSNHLFTLTDYAVITLYLSGNFSLTNLNIFGGDAPGNVIPGTLTGATIGFGGQTAAITSTPFNASGTCYSGPCDDAFSFAGTSLAGLSGSTVTLSGFQGGWADLSDSYFSISEIDVTGTPATTMPEPASVALVAAGLALVAAAARRRSCKTVA